MVTLTITISSWLRLISNQIAFLTTAEDATFSYSTIEMNWSQLKRSRISYQMINAYRVTKSATFWSRLMWTILVPLPISSGLNPWLEISHFHSNAHFKWLKRSSTKTSPISEKANLSCQQIRIILNSWRQIWTLPWRRNLLRHSESHLLDKVLLSMTCLERNDDWYYLNH